VRLEIILNYLLKQGSHSSGRKKSSFPVQFLNFPGGFGHSSQPKYAIYKKETFIIDLHHLFLCNTNYLTRYSCYSVKTSINRLIIPKNSRSSIKFHEFSRRFPGWQISRCFPGEQERCKVADNNKKPCYKWSDVDLISSLQSLSRVDTHLNWRHHSSHEQLNELMRAVQSNHRETFRLPGSGRICSSGRRCAYAGWSHNSCHLCTCTTCVRWGHDERISTRACIHIAPVTNCWQQQCTLV